jgi:hypothetical protein
VAAFAAAIDFPGGFAETANAETARRVAFPGAPMPLDDDPAPVAERREVTRFHYPDRADCGCLLCKPPAHERPAGFRPPALAPWQQRQADARHAETSTVGTPAKRAPGEQRIGAMQAGFAMTPSAIRPGARLAPSDPTGGATYGTAHATARLRLAAARLAKVNAETQEMLDRMALRDALRGNPWDVRPTGERRRWTGHHAADCPCRTCSGRSI